MSDETNVAEPSGASGGYPFLLNAFSCVGSIGCVDFIVQAATNGKAKLIRFVLESVFG